ncbi:hypothetical protein NBO_1267g0002 [Nosema bombycis CQ1]|uniref:Uncharacterized protein n=1 Tax=Nosema bombycis (strain CQ1 / CVCC 102059) TaxID=578461 RepID=R0M020_NOSB1|nr:hypothetical protein NBO_1267g0002 [Nosema bombycis CQ1]|eukprot:EOB11349.1 hypothetical protein NBO_1267g0002 [Nosema bombycis CQ1]
MSIHNQILQALQDIKELPIFDKYRLILKDKKKLKRSDWLNLRELLKTDFIYEVINLDLTPRENKIIGNCIKSITLKNPNEVLNVLLKNRNYCLLESLLHKGIKNLNIDPIQPFLLEMIKIKEIKLNHLILLETIKKKYPILIEEEEIKGFINKKWDEKKGRWV